MVSKSLVNNSLALIPLFVSTLSPNMKRGSVMRKKK